MPPPAGSAYLGIETWPIGLIAWFAVFGDGWGLTYAVKTKADPRTVVAPARRELAGLDKIKIEKPVIEISDKDLDGMIEREYIRAVVVRSKTQYFLDTSTAGSGPSAAAGRTR